MKNNVKFEIMTEDKSAAINSLIVRHVAKYFPAFTIQKHTGFWIGACEKSLTIVIVTPPKNRATVYEVAAKIKCFGRQDCVLVVETKVKTEFI